MRGLYVGLGVVVLSFGCSDACLRHSDCASGYTCMAGTCVAPESEAGVEDAEVDAFVPLDSFVSLDGGEELDAAPDAEVDAQAETDGAVVATDGALETDGDVPDAMATDGALETDGDVPDAMVSDDAGLDADAATDGGGS